MTDAELLEKLQDMVVRQYGLSKLVSLDGKRMENVRQVIEAASFETDGFRHENEKSRIKRMEFNDETGFSMRLHFPGVVLLAAEVAQMFRDGGAINVLEFEVCPPDMEALVVTFQRAGHKTPMQLRGEVLRELEIAKNRIVELESQLGSIEST